jgi:carbonic anhydrase/acetyltransferase-like protein (isoleucine patch superfamily)
MIHQLADKNVKREGKNWIADSAKVIGDIHLKNECSIWFGAVLRGDIENITIGEGSNVQDNSVIHTDDGCGVNVGSGVTIGHLVMLHGCTIKDDSLIGIGAVVLNNAVVGKNCIIGANSLITENKKIPDRSLVMGAPGKVIREVTDEEIEAIKENARRYISNWKNYEKAYK